MSGEAAPFKVGQKVFWLVITVFGVAVIIAAGITVTTQQRDRAVCEALGGIPVEVDAGVRCVEDPTWIELP